MRVNEGRIILHSDLNNFFASVECALDPSLRGRPVAVCGDPEARHGIVLAKSYAAKAYDVKTGEALWQARQKCPSLIFVKAHYETYMRYSRMARDIYASYSDKIEPFGADEAWIDLSRDRAVRTLADAKKIADEIRDRIFSEMGLTASVGVSDNKIFAKLASDYKKPDATTVFSRENYGSVVARLPVSDLLYVGRSTAATLSRFGIRTIGDLAKSSPEFVRTVLGKNGEALRRSARGEDTSEVVPGTFGDVVKSIGNSCTPPRDLADNEDVRAMCFQLAESVGARLRAQGLKGTVLQISIRESDLQTHEHQTRLSLPTDSTLTIAKESYRLFCAVYDWHRPVRSMGVRLSQLAPFAPFQLSLFDGEIRKREAQAKIDRTLDALRSRFGNGAVRRGVLFCDRHLTGGSVRDDSKLRCAFAQH